MTIKNLIKNLNLQYVNSNITATNFPDDGRRGDVEIIRFNREIGSQEVINEMEQKGYRVATAYELLNWAKDNWDGKETVLGLGQIWLDPYQRSNVVCLWGNAGRRGISLDWFDLGWFRSYRFAFVRKSENVETGNLETMTQHKSIVKEK